MQYGYWFHVLCFIVVIIQVSIKFMWRIYSYSSWFLNQYCRQNCPSSRVVHLMLSYVACLHQYLTTQKYEKYELRTHFMRCMVSVKCCYLFFLLSLICILFYRVVTRHGNFHFITNTRKPLALHYCVCAWSAPNTYIVFCPSQNAIINVSCGRNSLEACNVYRTIRKFDSCRFEF